MTDDPIDFSSIAPDRDRISFEGRIRDILEQATPELKRMAAQSSPDGIAPVVERWGRSLIAASVLVSALGSATVGHFQRERQRALESQEAAIMLGFPDDLVARLDPSMTEARP